MPLIQTDVMTQNVILGPSVLSPWRYVFISQKAYQESETRPESSVYTLMKGTAVLGDDILDTVEYARPSEVSSEQTLQHHQGCFTSFTLTASLCNPDWLIAFLMHFPHRAVMWLVRYWEEKLRMIRVKEPALRWEVIKSFADMWTPVFSHDWTPVLFHFSISVSPMPTAQKTPTVSREKLTLMAMVLFFTPHSLSSSLFGLYFIAHMFKHLFFAGRRTGRCVQYYNHTFKTCEVQSWCPIEEYAVVR